MKQEVTIVRILDAPRERVWAAWTTPAQFASWYGVEPYPTDPKSVAMDVRVNGEWQATMVSTEDGSTIPFTGSYKEVAEPERLVFIMRDPFNPSNPNVEVGTVVLKEVNGKTEMTFTQSGNLPPEEYANGLNKGWNSFFDQLEIIIK